MTIIRVIQATSTELTPGWNHVQSVEIGSQLASGEGAFGNVHDCQSVNGSVPLTALVVKVFKQDDQGNDRRGYSTICKLQERIRAKHQELSNSGRSLTDMPGLYALPQFSFEGELAGQIVFGYAAHKLDSRLFWPFHDILESKSLFPKFRRLDLNKKLQMALDLVECFSILREVNYIHADINSQNLFINLEYGHVVLIDYDSGVVVDRPEDSPMTFGKLGEPDWLAPELNKQLSSSAGEQQIVTVDLFTDTWSVAVGIHYFLFDRFPYFYLDNLGPEDLEAYLSKYQWPKVDFQYSNFDSRKSAIYSAYWNTFEHSDPALKRAFKATFGEGALMRNRRATYAQWIQGLRPLVKPIPFVVAPPTKISPAPTPLSTRPYPLSQPIQKPQPRRSRGRPPSQQAIVPTVNPPPPIAPTVKAAFVRFRHLVTIVGLLAGGLLGYLLFIVLPEQGLKPATANVAELVALVAIVFVCGRDAWLGGLVGMLILFWVLGKWSPFIAFIASWSIAYGMLLNLAARRLFVLYQTGAHTALRAMILIPGIALAAAIVIGGVFFERIEVEWQQTEIGEQRRVQEGAEAQREIQQETAERRARQEAEAQRKAQEEAEARRRAQQEAEAQKKAQERAEAQKKVQQENAERRARLEAEAQARYNQAVKEAQIQYNRAVNTANNKYNQELDIALQEFRLGASRARSAGPFGNPVAIAKATRQRYEQARSEAWRRYERASSEAWRRYERASSEARQRYEQAIEENAQMDEARRRTEDKQSRTSRNPSPTGPMTSIPQIFPDSPQNPESKMIKPSFDCNKATTFVESEICNNATLANFDAELGRVYHLAKTMLPDFAWKRLRAEQLAWLNYRDERLKSMCVINGHIDAKCARPLWEKRIAEISNQLRETKP